jgi:Protein of unknown function (DUF3987)
MSLEPDRDEIEQFTDALLRHSGDGFISLRAFLEADSRKPFKISPVQMSGTNLKLLNKRAFEVAREAANHTHPVVFCPPLAILRDRNGAKESNIAEGPVLSVECDQRPQGALQKLSPIIGPPTLTVLSGGAWADPETGEIQSKRHLHWRLARPARGDQQLQALKQARDIATRIAGGDPSNKPVCHPIRWPGSWHRKRQPVLCRIETIDPAREIDLIDALANLKVACPEVKTEAGDGASLGAPEGHDWAALISGVLTGEDYHHALTVLAAKLLATKMASGAAVNMLRGWMEASEGPRDARWQARFDYIPRAVKSAADKYGRPGDAGHGQDRHEPHSVNSVSSVKRESTEPTGGAKSESWPEPDLGVLRLHRRPAVPFPVEVLGDKWGPWAENAARSAASPVDYVASTLLTSVSALVGNARWAQGWDGWAEPPHLWGCNVGDSGDGKSPGADTVLKHVVPEIEYRMAREFPDQLREARKDIEIAKARRDNWKAEVKAAIQSSKSPPPQPDAVPEEPIAPRLVMDDVTHEKVALVLAHAAPNGVLMVRDEIAGWLLGMNAYNEAARGFWIEAYGGRRKSVDRVKHSEPIIVPRLAVSWHGGIQPDRLAEVMRAADDGLLARFMWFWPEPIPFHRPKNPPDIGWAIAAFDRLRTLELFYDKRDLSRPPAPLLVALDEAAAAYLERFAQLMQAQKETAAGLLRSAMGKARGLVLRLSLVLEFLYWCAEDGYKAPPESIRKDSLLAAAKLVAEYIMPMAERTYGDAACTTVDRNTTTLARWIADKRPAAVHVREMQRNVRLPGLTTAEAIHGACAALVEAAWLGERDRIPAAREDVVSGVTALVGGASPMTDWSRLYHQLRHSDSVDTLDTVDSLSTQGDVAGSGPTDRRESVKSVQSINVSKGVGNAAGGAPDVGISDLALPSNIVDTFDTLRACRFPPLSAPDIWLSGICRLHQRHNPCYPRTESWIAFLRDCERFLAGWADTAAEQGWSAETLFGVLRNKPNVATWWGVMLLLQGGTILDISPELMQLKTRRGIRQSLGRPHPPAGAEVVPVWDLIPDSAGSPGERRQAMDGGQRWTFPRFMNGASTSGAVRLPITTSSLRGAASDCSRSRTSAAPCTIPAADWAPFRRR